MPRATERAASSIAEDEQTGWILVEFPAARPGWYRIRAVSRVQHWVAIDCGRGAPYVTPAYEALKWAPEEPPAIWWKPW